MGYKKKYINIKAWIFALYTGALVAKLVGGDFPSTFLEILTFQECSYNLRFQYSCESVFFPGFQYVLWIILLFWAAWEDIREEFNKGLNKDNDSKKDSL